MADPVQKNPAPLTPTANQQASPALRELINLGESLKDTTLRLRWRRCTSWMEQAEQEIANRKLDEAFIFCWIAFNAAYAQDTQEQRESFELEAIRKYFGILAELDTEKSIPKAIFDNENRWNQIQEILGNQYIFQDFWKAQQGNYRPISWEESMKRSKDKVIRAQRNRDARAVLEELFGRLYILRNQIFHGSATYKGSMNRWQVEYGAVLLYLLLPVFLKLMFKNPDVDWGTPKYPALYRNSNS